MGQSGEGLMTMNGEDHVVGMVEAEIRHGNLIPGSRLPTEREWVERSGMSRTTVRRALTQLEAQGQIVRYVGRGTFVASRATAGDDAEMMYCSPAEIIAVRLVLEPAIMPLVVLSARQTDFDEIERCLRGGENDRDYGAFEKWDIAFHRALAAASHNQLLIAMTRQMNETRDQRLWGHLKRRNFSLERSEEYMRDHRKIALAVYERDALAAQAAMHAHLIRIRSHILGE